jgi:TRAP-type C4-dicarboxylate transport system permease small subunit
MSQSLALRLATRLASAQLVVAMLALGVMGSVTVADVALKYLAHRPIAGAYDLVESLLPVVIFHGLPTTLLRRQNIAIDLIDHVVGPRGTRALIGFCEWVMLGLLALFAWAMLSPALQALDYGDRKLELGLPLVVVWIAAILGMIGSALVMLALRLSPQPARGA